MLNKINKNLIMLLFIIVVIFSVISPISASFALSDINFDNVDVMTDLEKAENFNFNDYPAGGGRKMEIANFVEYCYSPISNHQGNYGLYIYLYNPKNVNFKKDAENTVQMAISLPSGNDEPESISSYQIYKLQHLSASTGNYKNLFHKFKILGADNLINQVNSNLRIYNVSGIELIKEDDSIEDYKIGGQYRFTGFAKGYGLDSDAENTLDCKVTTTDTIELNVQSTFYRLKDGQSAAGPGHKDNLSSVYFAIDNSTLEKWGNLNAIRARWLEYHVAPTVVVNKKDVYDDLMQKAVGKVIPIDKVGVDYNKYYLYSTDTTLGGAELYNYCWNAPSTASSYPNQSNYYNQLTNLHYTPADLTGNDSDIAARISAEDQKLYWKNYNKSFERGRVGKNQYSADLFINKVDKGRGEAGLKDVLIDNRKTWNLLSYEENKYSWQELNYKESAKGIYPIAEVRDEDMKGNSSEISNRLYIDIDDIKDFTTYRTAAKMQNKTTFLFRFAVTDMYSSRLYIGGEGNIWGHSNKNAYVFMQTAFLDFDIIELTFNKEGNYKVIPVVSNPIDIVGDTELPPDVSKNSFWEWLIELIKKIIKAIATIIGIVLAAWLIAKVITIIISLFKAGKSSTKNINKATPVNIYMGDIKATEQAKTNAKQRYKTSYKGDTKNEKEKKSKGNKKRSKQSKKNRQKKTDSKNNGT